MDMRIILVEHPIDESLFEKSGSAGYGFHRGFSNGDRLWARGVRTPSRFDSRDLSLERQTADNR